MCVCRTAVGGYCEHFVEKSDIVKIILHFKQICFKSDDFNDTFFNLNVWKVYIWVVLCVYIFLCQIYVMVNRNTLLTPV